MRLLVIFALGALCAIPTGVRSEDPIPCCRRVARQR